MRKLEQISDIITKYFDTTIASVQSPTRVANVRNARHLICYFAKTDLRLTFLEIAEWMGGRDHTTAMNSCRQVRNSLNTQTYLYDDFNNLREEVYKIAYKGHMSLVIKSDPNVDVKGIVSEIRQTYPHVTFLIA